MFSREIIESMSYGFNNKFEALQEKDKYFTLYKKEMFDFINANCNNVRDFDDLLNDVIAAASTLGYYIGVSEGADLVSSLTRKDFPEQVLIATNSLLQGNSMDLKVQSEINLEPHINRFFLDCSDELMPILNGNDEYQKAGVLYSQIRDEIESLLPEDKKELVEDLYEAESTQKALYNKALFIRSFQYSMEIRKLFGLSN